VYVKQAEEDHLGAAREALPLHITEAIYIYIHTHIYTYIYTHTHT
jgi:hypothetical protein